MKSDLKLKEKNLVPASNHSKKVLQLYSNSIKTVLMKKKLKTSPTNIN